MKYLVQCMLYFLFFTSLLLPFSATANTTQLEKSLTFSPEEQQYLTQKQQITMCIDPDWLPLEAIENGIHIGMSAEYMQIFSKSFGIPITLIPTSDWSQALQYAKERKCDIFSLAMPTPDRETYMIFSKPYLEIPLVMATKTDAPFIDKITSITDRQIGMVKGYAFNELLRNKYPTMKVVDVTSVQDGLEKVVEGKIFGFIGTLATVGYSIQRHFTGELKVSGKFDERWKLGVGARKDEPLLAQIFNKSIATIDTAKQQEILNNWIAVRYEKGRDYRLIIQIASFAFVLLLVLLYRNFTLKKYSLKLEQQNQKIKRQAERLHQTKQELLFTQHAVETCAYPIIWVKHASTLKETEIIHANKAAAALLGYKVDELVGLSLAEIDSETTEDQWHLEVEEMQKSAFYTMGGSYLKKDGSTFPAEKYLNYFEYEDATYHFTFFMDVSRQKKMEKKLHRSMKMEAVGLMAGGVAHDLNNILSGIVSYPELMLMQLPEDSSLRKPVTLIREAGLRAAEVVADMLTVTRGTAAAREVTNINQLIEELIDSPECKQIEQKNASTTISTELDLDLLNISCSTMHIRKTLMNLLFNASEAMDKGGTITICSKNRYIEKPVAGNEFLKRGEYVLLSISDTGSGISEEDQKHIFEPFYSKKVMGKSGTGLGLTIVWNTIQDHGGDITLKSSSEGTTFTLYFPATRKKSAVQELQKEPATLHGGNGERILVVDDEELQRDIASQLLTALGYEAHSVPSGEEAVALIQEEDFDLVLLDMIMEPGMNGRVCFEQMRTHKQKIKAIIASGFSESDEVKRALQQGVSQFIRKPYTMQQLERSVNEALRTRQ